MYMIPKQYKCPDKSCGYEFMWSEDHKITPFNEPFCPKCYLEFIKEFVPIGKLVNHYPYLDIKVE